METLEGFFLVPVPQDSVGNVRIDPATHGIREPAVPEVVDRGFGIEAHGFCRGSPASSQQVLKWSPRGMTASLSQGSFFLPFRPGLVLRCAGQPLYWFQKSFI